MSTRNVLRLLLVEDSPFDARLISEQLAAGAPPEYSLRHVDRLDLAREELAAGDVDCVLLDLGLPDANGVQSVLSLLAAHPDVPLVVLSAADEGVIGAEAVHAGAQDFLTKGELDGRQLWRAIRYALERKKVEMLLRQQALHDTLTGLPNRGLFLDRLELSLARLRREPGQVCVMFLDLDGFKWVNDSLGHDAGDVVIVEVARRIQQVLRPYDTAARLGGDEFVILAEGPQDDVAATTRLAERVLQRLRQPVHVLGAEVRISASIGITCTSLGDSVPGNLVRDADAAMYRAKALGKNRYLLFDEGMRAQVKDRVVLLNELHLALESSSFTVLYQPIVDLNDGAVRGWEAVLQWQHPDGRPMAASELLGVLEEHGLLAAVGSAVMKTAMEWLAGRAPTLPQGPPPFISLNVSSGQLSQAGVVESLAGLIRSSGLLPEQVHLELSERQFLEARDGVRVRMDELKQLGLRLTMDDYGVGGSTLQHLRELPFDALKLHSSFIVELPDSDTDRTIVASVVAIGHSLGLDVLADGVESEGQARLLREMGCELGQGGFFGEPTVAGVGAS